MKAIQTSLLAVMLAALTTAGSGCASNAAIENGQATLPEGENSAAFLDRVSAKRQVNENDAARGLLLLLDDRDEAATFAERIAALHDAGIVETSWDHDALRPIGRGRLAEMIYRAIDLPAGVVLTLTGPSPRYCLRELQYRRMMAVGPVNAPVGGMEFVSVLTRAAKYRQSGEVPNLVGNTSQDPKE